MSGELEATLALAQAGELEPAIVQLEHLLLDASTERVHLQAEALELLGRCQHGKLANVQAQEAFAEAARLYSQAGDEEAAAYCELMKVRQLLDERLLRQARELITAGQSLAGRQGWQDLHALASEFRGLASLYVKEHGSATRQFREVMARPDRRKLSWEHLALRMALGSCHLALGDVKRSQEELAAVNADPRTAMIPRLGIHAEMSLGYNDWLAGDYANARRRFAAVAELAEQSLPGSVGMRWLYNVANYNLGLVCLQLGDYRLAHDKILVTWQVSREQGQSQLACACLSSLCLTSLMLDQTSEALRYCRLCHELAVRHEDFETHILPYYMAVAYLANGELEQANKYWAAKPLLENNSETELQYSWLVGLLDHLTNGAMLKLGQTAQNLAWQWRGEILELARGECFTRALP